MLKLYEWIKYREYADYTVVYDTKNNKKTIFSGIAYDIMQLLEKERSFSEIVDSIITKYDITLQQQADIERDIESFVSMLIDSSMVSCPTIEEDNRLDSADDLLLNICSDNNQLEHVYFELTYRCNQKCIHCYEGHNVHCSELSFAEICSLLDQLREMGVLELTFTGGEVAVREDFLAICAYASVLGFVIHIYTNGIGFSDSAITELCEMHIADIAFSIYSINEDIHDNITGMPGSLKRTLRTLFAFRSAGVCTIIKTVVMKQNSESFKELVEFAKIMQIPLETSMQVLATDKDDGRIYQHRLADEELYYKYMRYEAEAFEYGVSCNQYCAHSRTTVCGLGKCLNITPDGTVFPCNVLNLALGNIRDMSINEIWNSSQLEKLRQFNVRDLEEECQSCENLNYCLYCPGAMLRETGHMNKHTQDVCLLSNAKRRVFEYMSKKTKSGGEYNEEV